MGRDASAFPCIETRLTPNGPGDGSFIPCSRRTNTIGIERCSKGCNSSSPAGDYGPKGPRSSVLTYAVDSLEDLEANILPFFERHRLLVKQDDFRAFAIVVRALRRKEHFTKSGFERLVRLAYGMNAAGKQRARSLHDILGSSETARQAVP